MDKITKKKDFKLLIAFFSLEALILLICFMIAHAKVNRALDVSIGSGKYGNFIDSIRCVRSNILEKSFDGGRTGGLYDNPQLRYGRRMQRRSKRYPISNIIRLTFPIQGLPRI